MTRDEALKIYETMVRIRTFDETAAALFEAGELPGFVHPYSGEEAIAAGVCSELTKDDCVCSTHRGHGHIIAKGADTKRMMAELFGKVSGYSGGKSGSMHIADFSLGIIGANGIVAADIVVANGVAFALQYRGKDAVCVAFFGDGASNRGPFHEGLNLAATWDLPTIFVCENNNFASTTARKTAMRIERIAERAAAYGMTGVTIDGNDPIAVKHAVRAARDRMKRGGGQTLIEAVTWRHHQHFVGDRHVYKNPEEQERWLSDEMDPIPRFERVLAARGLAGAADFADVKKRAEEELAAAVAFAKADAYPSAETLTDCVYREG